MMKIEMAIVAATLALLCGCARQDSSDNSKIGFLSISTNALLAAIPVGMHQDEVVKKIGRPVDVVHKGVILRTTNSTGPTADAPMVVWVYACKDGSMWVVFGTNKVVHAVEPNPAMSL
jgi:hypothetical protein